MGNKKYAFAIFIMLSIAFIGELLSKYIPGLGAITIALLVAILIAQFRNFSTEEKTVFQFAEKNMLAWATIILGFGLNLQTLSSLSWTFLIVIFLLVALSLFTGHLAGKFFISPKLGWLLGAGNGICGNSAIAATAPMLKASTIEIGLAITAVNLLGTLGIFLFPSLSALFELTPEESALFTGAVLQSVGHVLAASMTIDPEISNLALLVKMGRILLLAPSLLFIGFINTDGSSPGQKIKIKGLIPYYVWGFLVASIVASINILPAELVTLFSKTGTYLLLFAMVGIGLNIQIKKLLQLGSKTFIAGSSIFIIQIIFIISLIYMIR
jgi:uncharacterized integral membrane protein (TIGR00698 family)